MLNTKNSDIIKKYFDLVQEEIKRLISEDSEIKPNQIQEFNNEIFNQSKEIQTQIRNYIDNASLNNLDIKKVSKIIYDRFKLQVKNNLFNQDDVNDVPNKLMDESKFITKFKEYNKLYESYELSGKYSFMTFLQIITNHDYHFILNDLYTKLYKYHFFFSTETIKDVNEFMEIFKYKHSLASSYKILTEINDKKLAFFFGLKNEFELRYGFLDLDTQRSYVVGEFKITDNYFKTISKYKCLQFVNKMLQNINIKNLELISKIKLDFENFYTSKKSIKTEVIDNRIIKYYEKDQFTDEDLQMNRPFRILDKWISKKQWKNKVEYNVDDTKDKLEFIIIIK